MRVDPHAFAENFIPEDHFKSQARARGVELGTVDTTPGAGAFLKFLASALKYFETKLASKIANRFFIAGLPDAVLGTRVVLIIEGEVKEIDAVIFDSLDKFEKPKEVFFVSEFVETETKKINRSQTLEKIKLQKIRI